MAALWNIPEINHWWLSNEEDYPLVVRNVRLVMEHSLEEADPRQRSQEQRDMVGIFTSLNLDEGGKAQAQP